MISSMLVKVLLDKKTEKIMTAKEAHDIYMEQQRTGGIARLQLWTYSPVYKRFAFQYPLGFMRETNARDLIVFSVDINSLGKKKYKELDIPLFSVGRVLIDLNGLPSLLLAQAVKNFQVKKCALAIVNGWDKLVFLPITKADAFKAAEVDKYKFPAKDIDVKTYDIYRLTYRDAAATVSEFCIVS